MKKIFTFIIAAFIFLAHQAEAQITIAAARAQSIGSTVTVRGIVTSGGEFGNSIRYIQDATAGIALYSFSNSIPPANIGMASLNPGDSIQVTGNIKSYNNLLELDPVTSLQVLATNRPIPAPVVFIGANMTNAFAEQYEGMLVQLNNLDSVRTTSGQPFGAFSGNTNYTVYAGGNTRELRINNYSSGPSGLVGYQAPGGNFSAIGIMGQYSSSNPTSGYQLLPRLQPDIILPATPNISSQVKTINISTTGFTVTFQTQNPGSTHLEYGLTPALGTVLNDTTKSTTHSTVITGLTPATLYYVQVSSTNSNGTSTSGIIPMMTKSNSSGDIKVYFNQPVATQFATSGNQALVLPNAMNDTLAAYINRAMQSVDVTIYHWADTTILNALNNAQQRGVTVRVIYDIPGSTPGGTFVPANPSVHNLNSNIQKLGRNDGSIMHNKFVIIDANSTDPNKAILWTGSTNWSDHQLFDDPNSVIIIQDQSMAKTYLMEFNEMWNNGTTGVFGADKTDNTPHFFHVGNTEMEVYFSPTDNVNTRIIETVNSADNDLHFASMIVTRTDIANAIAQQLSSQNITSCSEGLVNDTTQAAETPWRMMRQVMGNRIQLNAFSHIMHHKYLIVDAVAPNSDPTVLVGSHNWSTAADTRNDENTLIIHSAAIANQYYQELSQRILDQQPNMNMCFRVTAVHEQLNADVSNIKVYPNPNNGQFAVAMTSTNPELIEVKMYSADGRVVYQNKLKTNAENEVKVNTTDLPAGLYFLQLSGNNFSQNSRVVIY